MVRVPGPGSVLNDLIDRFDTLVTRILSRITTAAARALGGTENPVHRVAVSLDDLGTIRTFWVQHLDQEILPALQVVFDQAAGRVAGVLGETVNEALAAPDAAEYLRQARNRLVGVGDNLWAHARHTLAEGVAAGEDIEALTARVAGAAGLAEPRARVIARTEVIGAHNAATVAQARMLGDASVVKEWLATPGPAGAGCDAHTRPTHCAADGQRVRIGTRFVVGGAHLDYPGDPTGPANEIVQCRCSIAIDLNDEPLIAANGPDPYVRDGEGKFAKEPGGGHTPDSGPSQFGGMHLATDTDKAAFRTTVGKAIPPGWSDVHIADDLGSAQLLVRGKDKKGRGQSIYSAEHTANQAAVKFVRVQELSRHTDKLDHAVERDAAGNDSAAALLLIRRLGMRPGSDRNTGADKQAHGATNLRTSHVKVDGTTTSFDFTGKKGVHIQLQVDDPLIASTVKTRLDKLGPDVPLFDTDEQKTRDYMHTTGVPAGFLLKDLRTLRANVVALRAVKARGKDAMPTTKAEFQRWRKDVAVQVSAELGNTPTLALSSYINSTVFANWLGDESWA